MRSLLRLSLFLLLACFASATPLLAQENLQWTGLGSSGDFNNLNNWIVIDPLDPLYNLPPTSWITSDTLNIQTDSTNVGSGYTAVIGSTPSVTFNNIWLGYTGTTTVAHSGSVLQNAGNVTLTGQLVIGNADAGVASLWHMTGGTINKTTGSINLGTNTGNGMLWMDGAGTVTSTGGYLYIGVNGTSSGTLTMSGSAKLTGNTILYAAYGSSATCSASINMGGNSILSNTSTCYFGYTSAGTSSLVTANVTLSDYASFTTPGTVYLGYDSVSYGSAGTLTMNNYSTFTETAGTFYCGLYHGTATVNLKDHAVMTHSSGSTYIGYGYDNNSSFNMSGTSTFNQTLGSILVGYSGTGTTGAQGLLSRV